MRYTAKSFKYLSILLLLVVVFQSCGAISAAGISKQGLSAKKAPANLEAATAVSSVKVDHQAWTLLLSKHVSENGFVDYKGFAEDKTTLNAYCSYLSGFQPDESWSVQEQLAYYINLYNAYTVKLIVDNYPVKSIKDLDAPWTKALVPVGTKKLSLGGIENSLLRKMNEPRIHFAINCASFSCPKLLNEAFTADRIDEQLETVTREFINGPNNQLDADNPRVSQLFNWYAKDYLANGVTSVVGFINNYSFVKIKAGTELQFMEYDWSLNEQ